jgi:hypothetical protein
MRYVLGILSTWAALAFFGAAVIYKVALRHLDKPKDREWEYFTFQFTITPKQKERKRG